MTKRSSQSDYAYRLELEQVYYFGETASGVRKHVVPLATWHRVMCILAHQKGCEPDHRSKVKVERIPLGSSGTWEPVYMGFPVPHKPDCKVTAWESPESECDCS